MEPAEHSTQISSRSAQTLARGLRLVEFLTAAPEPLRPSELARSLGLDRNVIYRLLLELEAHSYVTKVPGRGGYVIGSGLIALAAKVLRKVDVRQSARPYMESISEATGETVSLHVRHDQSRICVETIPGRHAISRVVQIGQTLPLYAGPSGKVILAFMEPGEVDAIIAQAAAEGLDGKRIRRDLNGIRDRGYIASVGDRTPGVGGLSVPVFKADGLAAALTVSGPASRWTQKEMERSAELVKGVCASISESLGYVPS